MRMIEGGRQRADAVAERLAGQLGFGAAAAVDAAAVGCPHTNFVGAVVGYAADYVVVAAAVAASTPLPGALMLAGGSAPRRGRLPWIGSEQHSHHVHYRYQKHKDHQNRHCCHYSQRPWIG